MNNYVGHPNQTRGAEVYKLCGGKGEGMKFIYVRNGLGLEAWISVDRAGDISRVNFKGDNFGFFSPSGYVAPQYYECFDEGFLKSFSAGFFTTCGLTTVGGPTTDGDEKLPMHGTIGNIPAIVNVIKDDECGLTVELTVTDARIFSRRLVLNRKYYFSYTENSFTVEDTVKNMGDDTSPYMILYHCNMGYPLLSEKSEIVVPNDGITPRTDNAAQYIDTAAIMEKPQARYQERCYYYDVKVKDGLARAGIYNPDINKGLVMSYDKEQLPCFTEWKMMGKTDYVLGLEPGNCIPDGRAVMRDAGTLRYIEPERSGTTSVKFSFIDDKDLFYKAF